MRENPVINPIEGENEKIYINPNDDPAIVALRKEILAATNLDPQVRNNKKATGLDNHADMWARVNIRESIHRWANFVSQYPEKAHAYRGQVSEIDKELTRQEEQAKIEETPTAPIPEEPEEPITQPLEPIVNSESSGTAVAPEKEKTTIKIGDIVTYTDKEYNLTAEWEVEGYDVETGRVQLKAEITRGDEPRTAHILASQEDLSAQGLQYLVPPKIKTSRKSPIKKGESFDSKSEIKKFGEPLGGEGGLDQNPEVVPKGKRRGELKKFKEKLAHQLEGISKLQDDLISFIRENPDSSAAEILLKLREMEKESPTGMTKEQERLAHTLIRAYITKHNKIESIRQEYEDDKDLFYALFGFWSKGGIEISRGPINFHIRIENEDDYAFALNVGHISVNSSGIAPDEIKNQLINNRGTLLEKTRLKNLEWGVAIEKGLGGDDDTLHHEEQHAIKNLFGEKVRDASLPKFENITGRKEIEEFAKAYLRVYRERGDGDESVDDQARDEIMAKFQRGTSPTQILDDIVTYYDYWSRFEKNNHVGANLQVILNTNLNNKIDPIIVSQAIEQVTVAEYRRLLKDSIDSLFVLVESGYSNNQAVDLLIHEPLSRWKKTVERVPGNKNVHSKDYQDLNQLLKQLSEDEKDQKEEEPKEKVYATEFGNETKTNLKQGSKEIKARKNAENDKEKLKAMEADERIEELKQRIEKLDQREQREKMRNVGDIDPAVIEKKYENLKFPLKQEINLNRLDKAKSIFSRILNWFKP